MREDFLHFIWQYQKFDSKQLSTTNGESITIFEKGHHNTNAGPDFKEARVKIDGIEWSGAIEIHLKASDWYKHKHDTDPNYNNVILHVVWEADKAIKHAVSNEEIPTLSLKNKIDLKLLHQYELIISAQSSIPCAAFWPEVNQLIKQQMLENAVIERLDVKSQKAALYQQSNSGDWEETTYFMLLSALGFKINSPAFERLAQLLPYSVVRKYKRDKLSTSALIFGTAGFLDDTFQDDAKFTLKKEWQFLKHKHRLERQLQQHEWNMLRLRPVNFPVVRLAQLAEILCATDSLFNLFAKSLNVKHLKKILQLPIINHFDENGAGKEIQIGRTSIESIILNTAPPLLTLYAKATDNAHYMDKAIETLEAFKAENNVITRKYQALGYDLKTAFDSQACIQLYNNYCDKKRCLDCKIGVSIMSKVK